MLDEVLHLQDCVRHKKSFPKWQAAKWPGRYSTQAGSSVRQISFAYTHRGWNRHAGGGSMRSGGSPSIENSSFDSRWIVDASSACVYGWTGVRNTSRTPPSSTNLPAYMTARRSQTSATIPRLWVMRTSDILYTRRRSSKISRIWASTITSSDVVGSSAIRSFGVITSDIAIMIR